ncbi:MAG: hypothetical protein GY828_03510, partial [Candidatus Gracilibacteria bacterium]|nr:hypothetical protein [Candidatus Gracilibacteria bacterium]
MNLFLDSISDPCALILFDDSREIFAEKRLAVRGNESSKLIPEIDLFLSDYSVSYDSIQNIVSVNGPGSFTGVRTSVLITNTINYLIQKNMTALQYFDLHENYPIIKS